MSVLTRTTSPPINSSGCRVVMSLGRAVALISVSLMLVNLTPDPLALITGVKLSFHYITIARGVYPALYLFSLFHLIQGVLNSQVARSVLVKQVVTKRIVRV